VDVPASPLMLEQAFKQFSLETERLERIYHHLSTQFQGVQQTFQDYRLAIAGKLAELDFVTRYLGTILNEMSQGILFIDLNGTVTTYNSAAQQLLDIPEKQVLFHPFNDFFEEGALGFSLKEIFQTKRCPPKKFIQWKHNNKTLDLEIETTFVCMASQPKSVDFSLANHQSVQGVLILIRNLTEIRQLQQMADRQSRLIELGELAAHLAHDIRNPLGGIKGYASLLEQELKDQPDLQQMASAISQGSDELNQFVTRVLDYARPFELQLQLFPIYPLVCDLRQLIQADSQWNPAVEFAIECQDPQLLLPVDVQLFKSALLNLFLNASQAMPDGGYLTVKITTDQQMAIFTIQDTGCGIAADHLAKIFSPFFTTKQKGNGLGLSEVHRIIQAHQGWINVDSELGQGTTFIIYIPLKIGDS
jgi:signal transduction histidine kinase